MDAGLTGKVSWDRRQSNAEAGRHAEDAAAIQDGVNVLADAGKHCLLILVFLCSWPKP